MSSTNTTPRPLRHIALAALAAGSFAVGAAILAPSANAAADIGGLDIQGYYCMPNFNAPAVALDPNSAFSWVCARNGQRAHPVNMDRVCTNQYGPGAFALPTNVFNAGSWRCYR
jgi:hypothetical protein